MQRRTIASMTKLHVVALITAHVISLAADTKAQNALAQVAVPLNTCCQAAVNAPRGPFHAQDSIQTLGNDAVDTEKGNFPPHSLFSPLSEAGTGFVTFREAMPSSVSHASKASDHSPEMAASPLSSSHSQPASSALPIQEAVV